MSLIKYLICIFLSIYIIKLYPPIECNYELVEYVLLEPQNQTNKEICYILYPIEYRYKISLNNNLNECIEKAKNKINKIHYYEPIYIDNNIDFNKKYIIFTEVIIIPFIFLMIGLL
jgi:hypothetical protein